MNLVIFCIGVFISALAVFGLWYTKREMENELKNRDVGDWEPADQDADAPPEKEDK